MLRRHLVLTALLGSLLIAPVASADVIDPTAVACASATEAGEPCQIIVEDEDEETVIEGTCQPGECCTQDYSNGSPPETVCGECFLCEAGPADATADASGGDASSSGGGSSSSSDDSGGCAGAPGGEWLTSLFSLLLGAGLVATLRRREA